MFITRISYYALGQILQESMVSRETKSLLMNNKNHNCTLTQTILDNETGNIKQMMFF